MSNAILQRFDFTTGDIDDLIPLIETEYPEGEMADARYLEWEYLRNPAGTPEMVVARSESNEIVGQYLVIPQNYNIAGETTLGSLSLNTLTRKDFRGQGLFTRMALATYEGCTARGLELTLGFPNMQSYPGFVRKLDFRHIGNAVVLACPLKIGALLRGALVRKRRRKYRSYREQEALPFWGEHEMGGIQISGFDPKPDAATYTPFWQARRGLYNQTDRSPEFLDWRYLRIPTREYALLKATVDGRFAAYIVLRMRVVYGMKAGFIIDFNCLPDPVSMKAGRGLLKFSKRLMRSAGAAFMGVLITPGTAEFTLLRQGGFFKAPERVLPHDAPIIIRWNGEGSEPPTLGSIDGWFLSFGDYDAF